MAAYYAPKEALKSKVGPHHFVCSVRPGRPARPNAVGFRRKAVHTKARRERSTASELSNQGDVHGSEVLDGVSSNIMCGFQVLQFKEMLRNNHMRALLAIIIPRTPGVVAQRKAEDSWGVLPAESSQNLKRLILQRRIIFHGSTFRFHVN